MKKLPDAEFEVMSAVWRLTPPVTSAMLMREIGRAKGWKAPALITLINRLIGRGFLRTEKPGRERAYYPLIERDAYLRFESESFLKRYHGGSLTSLMASLTGADAPLDGQAEALIRWVKEREGGNGL